MREGVHCKTKEQWIFVNSKLIEDLKGKEEYWNYHKENSCLDISPSRRDQRGGGFQ